MQDHQPLKTLSTGSNKYASVLGLWLFPIDAQLKPISLNETKWANKLNLKRKREYQHSRGYVRFALSELFGVDPLKIPLNASPGKVPELAKGWGYISLSHCSNALLIGWSPEKLGVDLERSNRTLNPTLLANRCFSKRDQDDLRKFDAETKRKVILSKWVIKEAAIKWQRGSIYSDLIKWNLSEDYKWAIHKSLNLKVNIEFFSYESWFIALAYNKNIHSKLPILCRS